MINNHHQSTQKEYEAVKKDQKTLEQSVFYSPWVYLGSIVGMILGAAGMYHGISKKDSFSLFGVSAAVLVGSGRAFYQTARLNVSHAELKKQKLYHRDTLNMLQQYRDIWNTKFPDLKDE